jgi:hypothetical protein
MFRLIRWMCFPIARRLGVWPIAVYYTLAVALVTVRWVWFPPSEQAMTYLPDWAFPAIYSIVFVVYPALMLAFRRRWFRVPQREAQT